LHEKPAQCRADAYRALSSELRIRADDDNEGNAQHDSNNSKKGYFATLVVPTLLVIHVYKRLKPSINSNSTRGARFLQKTHQSCCERTTISNMAYVSLRGGSIQHSQVTTVEALSAIAKKKIP
jgi:hypothetical protein